MKNEIATTHNQLTYSAEQVQLIKDTVAKDSTNAELQMFLYLAKQYDLDPFKKEIWFTKYNGQTNIMTSRDGYLKYAQLNPEFEGLISFVVHENDIFEIDAAEYKVNHKFGAKRGSISGAWAKCDRRGKKPFIAYVDFKEYNQGNKIWQKYPSAMIQKVAESFVLKRAFGINGLVTQEELSYTDVQKETNYQGTEIIDETVPMITKDQRVKAWEYAQANGMGAEELAVFSQKVIGKTKSNEMTYEEGAKLVAALENLIVLPEEDLDDIEIVGEEVGDEIFEGSPLGEDVGQEE